MHLFEWTLALLLGAVLVAGLSPRPLGRRRGEIGAMSSRKIAD
jgi:hypothetical protein